MCRRGYVKMTEQKCAISGRNSAPSATFRGNRTYVQPEEHAVGIGPLRDVPAPTTIEELRDAVEIARNTVESIERETAQIEQQHLNVDEQVGWMLYHGHFSGKQEKILFWYWRCMGECVILCYHESQWGGMYCESGGCSKFPAQTGDFLRRRH